MQAHVEPQGTGQKCDFGPHSPLIRTLTQCARNEN